MSNENLKVLFEAFMLKQTQQSDDVSLAQMMATPYQNDGRLAAAFHLFQYAFWLGYGRAMAKKISEETEVPNA